MPVDRLRENDQVVTALQHALGEGEHGLNVVPELIKRVLREARWQDRASDRLGREVAFEAFVDFIHEPPPEGLGTTVELVLRICGGDEEAQSLIEAATLRPDGRPKTVSNVNSYPLARPVGNTAQQALRQLRTHRPDLLERVVTGDLSPHAAAVEAGFRRKVVQIDVDPERAAVQLARHFGGVELDRLIDALQRQRG